MPQLCDDGPPGVLSMWCVLEPAAKQPQYRTNTITQYISLSNTIKLLAWARRRFDNDCC